MTLLIQNETKYDGRSVNGIVRWVFRELGLTGDGVVVKIKHHGSKNYAYKGRFYSNLHSSWGEFYDYSIGQWKDVAPNIPDTHRRLIVCRIGRADLYPRRNHVYRRKDSPGTWEIEDWKEALVCVTAHEAMHLRQCVTKGRGSGRYNEVETEWAAYRLWGRWRQANGCT